MKKLVLIQFLLLTPTLLFARCPDQKKQASILGSSKIDCGTLWHTIHNPTMTIGGKKYSIGLYQGDMSGECPDPRRGCYRPYLNLRARGAALCKAFGFAGYAKSGSGSAFKKLPDFLAHLERKDKDTFTPKLVRVNHSRSEYAFVKTLSCYPNYRK